MRIDVKGFLKLLGYPIRVYSNSRTGSTIPPPYSVSVPLERLVQPMVFDTSPKVSFLGVVLMIGTELKSIG